MRNTIEVKVHRQTNRQAAGDADGALGRRKVAADAEAAIRALMWSYVGYIVCVESWHFTRAPHVHHHLS